MGAVAHVDSRHEMSNLIPAGWMRVLKGLPKPPRSSASAEGFDEVCDAPVGGIGTGIQDGHKPVLRFVSRARIQIDVFEQLRKEFKVAAGVTR